MAATEYCLIYTYTGQTSNVDTGQIAPRVHKDSFTVSGDTDRRIGRITKIVFEHTHSSTGSPIWYLKGLITFADGSTIASDIVSHKFSSDIYQYTNTFTDNLPTASKIETWSSIEVVKATPIPSYALYWRANADYPMRVLVYFVEANTVKFNDNGTVKECEVYYNIGGTWTQVEPRCNVDGVWKQVGV